MRSSAPPRGRTLILPAAAAALLACAIAPAQEPATAPAPAAKAPAKPAAAKGSAEKAGAAAAPSQKDATSYSLGIIMGQQLREGGLGPEAINSQRIAQGVRDALAGKRQMNDADRKNMVELMRGAQEHLLDVNHRAAAQFLAENAKKPDIVTTASGLQYKVLATGNGESPKKSDEVSVNYKGTLLDGTEFDSSYKRGEPASFRVDRVIPGWTEALQLMKPGGKLQLFIPPQLAYDAHSRPPIPPGSMLIFEVELLGVKPGEAPAASGAAQPPPAPAPK